MPSNDAAASVCARTDAVHQYGSYQPTHTIMYRWTEDVSTLQCSPAHSRLISDPVPDRPSVAGQRALIALTPHINSLRFRLIIARYKQQLSATLELAATERASERASQRFVCQTWHIIAKVMMVHVPPTHATAPQSNVAVLRNRMSSSRPRYFKCRIAKLATSTSRSFLCHIKIYSPSV